MSRFIDIMERIGPLRSLAIWLVFSLLMALLIASIISPSVHAATLNGCEIVGTVGNVIVARCEDEETGTIIYANSAGFMLAAE